MEINFYYGLGMCLASFNMTFPRCSCTGGDVSKCNLTHPAVGMHGFGHRLNIPSAICPAGPMSRECQLEQVKTFAFRSAAAVGVIETAEATKFTFHLQLY